MPALADDPVPAPATAPADDGVVSEARKEFLRGAELVRQEKWGDALEAFGRASAIKAHAVTSYNIAQCERAMGFYTRARASLGRALAQDTASEGKELDGAVRDEARALAGEIERILPRITVTLSPADASVAVDGRPLERTGDASTAAFVAGTREPAPGEPMALRTFDVVANPGAHVFTVSLRGYQDVIVNKVFAPGTRATLSLELDRLPATLHVTSNLADAVVRVDDSDVGNTPAEITRNAGKYRVSVRRAGYVTYESEVTARAGERIEINAPMREEKRALTQRWWFWTAAGVLVVGAATTTYFLTRPDPSRPAPDAGGLGWSLKVP